MKLRHLGICGIVSLLSYTAMAVFGLFERLSAFAAVVFNAVLGIYLMKDAFPGTGKGQKT